MSWKRIVLYGIALNLLLFFRGCEQSGEIQITTGIFIPYQVVGLDEGGVQEGIEIASFSFPLLGVNLALTALFLLLIKRFLPKFDAFIGGRGFLVIAVLTFVIFNLVLVPNHVWAYAVFWPTAYLYEGAASLFYSGDPQEVPNVFIDVTSRLYFAIFLSVLSLIPLVCIWIRRRVELSDQMLVTPGESSGKL